MLRAMGRVLLVGAGGFVGSIARYWIAGMVQRLGDTEFPAGTLAVNVLGSFLIGLVLSLSLERGVLGANARLFLAVGVLGGFTTMSTFSYETLALLRDGSLPLALWNATATLGVCITAVWIGALVGRFV